MNQPTNGQLPLMTMLKKPSRVEDQVLASFGDNEEDAFNLAIAWAWRERRVRQMSQAHASQLLEIQPPHFCNILQGKKYLPLHKVNAFEELVGNTAVTQTLQRFVVLREEQKRQQIGDLVAEHLAPLQAVGGGRS